RNPFWMKDLSTVAFGIHELHPKKNAKEAAAAAEAAKAEEAKAAAPPKPAEDEADKPDMVIWHWKDRRLQPMQQVQENADKNFSYLCLFRPSDRKFMRLGDEDVRQVVISPES